MKPWLILSLFLVSNNFALALVDMNNANYSNTWVDLEAPGSGYDLRVLRAYKSRTLYDGLFGFGWCSEFETKLTVTPEGGVKINECGDGLEIYYSAKPVSNDEIEESVLAIINKLKMKSPAPSGDYLKKLSISLRQDILLREKYALENSTSKPVPKNTKLWANGREVEHVIFEKDIYTRTLTDGSSQRFDSSGRLTHVYNKSGQFLKFSYTSDRLSEISDDGSRKLIFKYYSSGKVQKIIGPNNLATEYKYSSNNDLIWNKVTSAKNEDEVFTYEYNEFHNLVKATWPDKTFISIKYDNKKDWVLSFIDRDKCIENYKYESDKTNPKLHYWSTVTKTCGREIKATNRYEFWHNLKTNGEVSLIRLLTKINGDTKDITYEDTFGKPKKIVYNGVVTEYSFYADGLVQTKSGPLEKQDFSYDSTHKKISKIVSYEIDQKGKVTRQTTSSYRYDKKGNLNYAENSDGKKIDLTYDINGRIKTIVDATNLVVKIEYEDKFGKPSSITKVGEGTVNITYTSTGDISKVESKQGPEAAAQIAGTFNTLLEIIAPANKALY